MIQMDLKSLKKGQKHYKVGYSIDYDTNNFCIEFFDGDGSQWYENESPLFLINRFKNLDKYQGKYSIIKHCNMCSKYGYASNSFDLDYRTSNIGNLSVHDEYGVFFKSHYDGYKAYKLHTYYSKDESTFYSLKTTKKHYEEMWAKNAVPPFANNLITTHTIPFIKSPDEIIEKLNTLITFS